MLSGIFVYFHFGVSPRSRAHTVQLLASTRLAVPITGGILLFYAFCTVVAYGYWRQQSGPMVLLEIAVISVVDLLFFALLWLRYWVQRERITKDALLTLGGGHD
jgi:hypothetical protein